MGIFTSKLPPSSPCLCFPWFFPVAHSYPSPTCIAHHRNSLGIRGCTEHIKQLIWEEKEVGTYHIFMYYLLAFENATSHLGWKHWPLFLFPLLFFAVGCCDESSKSGLLPILGGYICNTCCYTFNQHGSSEYFLMCNKSYIRND